VSGQAPPKLRQQRNVCVYAALSLRMLRQLSGWFQRLSARFWPFSDEFHQKVNIYFNPFNQSLTKPVYLNHGHMPFAFL